MPTGLNIKLSLAGALIFSLLIVSVVNPSILLRAPWGDENALLRNLLVINTIDVFFPLPLFDQASPPGATLLLKLIGHITNDNFLIMRILLLVIQFGLIYACATALGIKRKAIPLILFWLSTPLIQYSTDLKHYSGELIASYLSISAVALRDRSKAKLLSINFAALFFGFGAIIQVSAQIAMRSLQTIKGISCFSARSIVWLGTTCVIVIFFAVLGRYLVHVNMVNYQDITYKNFGFLWDAVHLLRTIVRAHGKILAVTGVVAFACACALRGLGNTIKNPLFIYLFTCLLITFFLRITGLYQAVYERHIIWLVPISIFMISYWLDEIFDRFSALFIPFCSATALAVVLVTASQPMEFASEKEMFRAVSKIPESANVVLNLGAQTSLELYANKNSLLAKHKYYGWVNPASGPSLPERTAMTLFAENAGRPGAFSSWTYFEMHQNFHPLWDYLIGAVPSREFYVVNSHQTPIGTSRPDFSSKAMVDVLENKGCNFKSVYAGNRTEVLKVQCP